MLNVSYSAIQSFRKCQQAYYYAHIKHLRRKDRPTPLELGSVLHSYLEHYYKSLKDKWSAQDAHEGAWEETATVWKPRLRQQAQAAMDTGDEDAAIKLGGMLAQAGRICERYYQVRGWRDADQWEVLFIEQSMALSIGPEMRSNGFLDLLARDRHTGRVSLWDHKSSESPTRVT